MNYIGCFSKSKDLFHAIHSLFFYKNRILSIFS